MKPRMSAFEKYLRKRIRELSIQFKEQYEASFIDDDSDSYDESQRLGARVAELRATLDEYLRSADAVSRR